ncbi:MAG: T9SS type A sorting domain-containing protein, partial [Ignavibacteria bacterium]|nr:T9SS type A sorting domain-containing protein [Ignavibacteria bacterium]
LPGGISAMFTGLGVFYPDYSPTQRIGIVADIEVKPTIKGIREGKDEVLETAFNHYFGTNAVEDNSMTPSTYSMNQNFPNPFNPSTKIEYQIPKAEYVSIKVFDLLGRVVAVLENQSKLPGKYSVQFEASKYSLSTGVYFYRLQTGRFVQTKKMVLMK